MPYLLIRKGLGQGKTLLLDRDKTILGRDEKVCHVVLELAYGTDQKKENTVSRKHAVITREQGKYYLADGDGRPSRNHTYLNGLRVPNGEKAPLKNFDVINICDCALVYCDDTEEPESPSSLDGSMSHENSSVYLAQPAEKLQLLLELSNRLSKTLDLDTLLPRMVESVLNLFRQADRGLLVLFEQAPIEADRRIVKTRKAEDAHKVAFSQGLVDLCLKMMQGLIINDVQKQIPNHTSFDDFKIRSVMCAPLWSHDGKAIGVLMVDSIHKKREFRQEDLNFLMGVASQASIALANARFLRDAIEKERVKQDMALARQVSRSFLPAAPPAVAGYEFFACNEPARDVGGDYYDFVPLAGGRHGILLGDVAGKGVAAALVMARFSAETRAAVRTEPDLAVAVRQLNGFMEPVNLTDRFVTLVAIALDPATHTLTVINAGHPAPLLLRRGTGAIDEAMPRDAVGPPLGVLPDATYEARQLQLEPGDCVLLFSDGVSEAMNANDQQFGVAGLRSLLERSNVAPQRLGEQALQAVKAHAAGREQHDDITLVCFGRV